MAQKQRTICIIGLGTFGTVLARELTRMNDRVVGLDCDESRVSDLADEPHSTVQIDATDNKALSQIGLDACDSIVVSIGDNIQANILACMNVLKLTDADLWAKADNEQHEEILRAVGVRHIVRPDQDYGLRIAQALHNPGLSDYLSLGDRKYVMKILIPERLAGRALSALKLSDLDLVCLGIFRDGELMSQDLEMLSLEAEDALLIYGMRPDLRRLADGF